VKVPPIIITPRLDGRFMVTLKGTGKSGRVRKASTTKKKRAISKRKNLVKQELRSPAERAAEIDKLINAKVDFALRNMRI